MSNLISMKNNVLSLSGLAVVWFFTVSLPYWIASSDSDPFPLQTGSLRFCGWFPIVVGGLLILWCYWTFIFLGKGIPWPFDSPKQLVISGPYRYVRNPMEGGHLLALFGEMLSFESSGLIPYMALSFLLLHMRQIFVEEPALRRRFGHSYEEYQKSVPRWIPRTTPYTSKG
jgi:protein-S-isoprenylcysteine O-methyltransferase Ste14